MGRCKMQFKQTTTAATKHQTKYIKQHRNTSSRECFSEAHIYFLTQTAESTRRTCALFWVIMGTLLNFSHFGLCALRQGKSLLDYLCTYLHTFFTFLLLLSSLYLGFATCTYNFWWIIIVHLVIWIYSRIRKARRVKLNYMGLALD